MTLRPICLSSPDLDETNNELVVAGWGRTQTQERSSLLQVKKKSPFWLQYVPTFTFLYLHYCVPLSARCWTWRRCLRDSAGPNIDHLMFKFWTGFEICSDSICLVFPSTKFFSLAARCAREVLVEQILAQGTVEDLSWRGRELLGILKVLDDDDGDDK